MNPIKNTYIENVSNTVFIKRFVSDLYNTMLIPGKKEKFKNVFELINMLNGRKLNPESRFGYGQPNIWIKILF